VVCKIVKTHEGLKNGRCDAFN